MAVADVTICKKRVDELLLASLDSRYSGVLSGRSTYTEDQEILDAILEADMLICQAHMATEGDLYRSTWLTQSGNLAHGALLPVSTGEIGQVSVDGAVANLAASKGEILAIRNNSAVYPLTTEWYFIEDVFIYHTGTNAVVYFTSFTKTTVCQAPQVDEGAIVAGTVSILLKDGMDQEMFTYYSNLFKMQIGLIKGEAQVVPQAEQFERAA